MDNLATAPAIGDLLALARRAWVERLRARLAARGYPDYRRADAYGLRVLTAGPLAVGRLAEPLGVSRQAARKLADGLVVRGYAEVTADPLDRRRSVVVLTAAGRAYAEAVAEAAAELEAELRRSVPPADLAVAAGVLAVLVRSGPGSRRIGPTAAERSGIPTDAAYPRVVPRYLVRVRLLDRPGALGLVASRIGAVGGDIVAIDILDRTAGSAVDEFVIELAGDQLTDLLRHEIHEVDGASVEELRCLDQEGARPEG